MLATTFADLDRSLDSARAILVPTRPLRLSEWASEHFYLSAESSYVEQRWTAYPYQVSILDAIGNDSIEEVTLRKSARVGYTKMILAAIGYFAEHKVRNQAIWQPTDEDSDEFVKTELEPMLRDVDKVRSVFPDFMQRNKKNTLRQKMFSGCTLHTRGGKAAKNYRRISVSVAMVDEVDAFDSDVDGEGSPVSLARKRIEGATFPKLVIGSTPKTKGRSLIDGRETNAELRLTFRFPAPCCGERDVLRWGGKNEPHGFKWTDGDPETVRHLCAKCGGLYTQAEYLDAYHAGRWTADNGTWIDDRDGTFRDPDGKVVLPPRSVAFFVWTANSPQTSWAQIVREFISAVKRADMGDTSELKAFVNTTLGESWEEGGEAVKGNVLEERAESYELGTVPAGGAVLTMSVDTQKDRLEWLIKAWGAFEESWQVGYGVIPGDPSKPEIWAALRKVIVEPLEHETGAEIRVFACAIDSGGHYSHEVYQFCRDNRTICPGTVFAVKGHSQRRRPIIGRPSVVDINRKGEKITKGAQLWMLGTDTAKDLILGRLKLTQPGPGYVHFSDGLPSEYYDQLTAEKLVARYVKGRVLFEWTKLAGARNEALDLEVYAVAAAQKIGVNRWKSRRWASELKRLRPKEPIPEEIKQQVAQAVAVRPVRQKRGGFVNRWRG